MNFKWLIRKCNHCGKLMWFEPDWKICYPCLYMLDQRLKREHKEHMAKFERELDEKFKDEDDD